MSGTVRSGAVTTMLNLPPMKRAVLTFALVLAGASAQAQMTPTPAAPAADDQAWSFSVAAYTFVLSDDRQYVQPSVDADHGRLHLEARQNYEALNTASLWGGANFSGGTTVAWEVTPMLGAVFGATAGIAPGVKASLDWRKLEAYGENEYVIDANSRGDSFFYNWSELTLAPAEWFGFGLVTERTRVYRSDREINRGGMARISVTHMDITAYLFDPDKDKRFVLAVEVKF
jgi:hypothetical protein